MILVLMLYLTGFIFYFMDFELRKPQYLAWGKHAVTLGLLVNVLYFGQAASTVAFLIAALSLILENRFKAPFLVLFSLPISLIFGLLALFTGGKALPPAQDPVWLTLHLGLIFAGAACLVTAAASALMYLLQSSQLKSKHLGKIFLELPSLDTLDRLHFFTLFWGIVLFSFGIVIGLFWANNLHDFVEVIRHPKVALSFLTGFFYWIILGLRLSALRRGQKIAYSTLVVLALLLITFVSAYWMPTIKGA